MPVVLSIDEVGLILNGVRNIKHTVVGHQDRHALSEMVLTALELLRFSTSIRLGAVCGVTEVLLGLSILVGTQEVETPA